MLKKKNIWHSGFTADSKHPAAQAAALTQSRHKKKSPWNRLILKDFGRVPSGIRTHDIQNHNLTL